ncbi:hypothetical protein MtrunA17_Chr8g0391321 [Medicago truncatula]|uniref:Uncharacterized protein n=1 Tax=Medicago truncatula TaxID=3880 RepID=A0A396GRH8_MEDTR|nr:hypothetical protein MtrunA17_Chr8g0391321 [Medicago truncatula]
MANTQQILHDNNFPIFNCHHHYAFTILFFYTKQPKSSSFQVFPLNDQSLLFLSLYFDQFNSEMNQYSQTCIKRHTTTRNPRITSQKITNRKFNCIRRISNNMKTRPFNSSISISTTTNIHIFAIIKCTQSKTTHPWSPTF